MSSRMPRAVSGLLAAALVSPLAVSSAVATTQSPSPDDPVVTESQSPEASGQPTLDSESVEPTPSSEPEPTESAEEPTEAPSEAPTESGLADDNDTEDPTGTDEPKDVRL